MTIARTAVSFVLAGSLAFTASPASAARKAKEPKTPPYPITSEVLAGLPLRGIGPAVTSGRIADITVVPGHPSTWFVASASGGVWKTTNAGTTWTPVFDSQGSYSIGCVTVDPNDPHTVWVGTGENNSQRSVSWGDGVYVSHDGGATWKRAGLEHSEHIGRIVVDPRDSRVVYVAAQGPLWRPGGDRGLYKTTDGGATWKRVLSISDDTGVNEVWMDPRNPDVLYATAYQRRRHVWTLIDGGPESGLYKSSDAGTTWRKITRGLPEVDLGRIGLCISPANPDVLYAIVEAAQGKGGVFRSTDRGESWEKRSDYVSSSPQYYNELVCDPKDVDTVYSMDTFMHVSRDGGATWTKVPETFKHVDNHALWIDPQDTRHMIAGCDGGVYETHDGAETWRFFANLPVTQFYRVTVDNSEPFYLVYGGTQDNATLGGPSRTTDHAGITNADWFVTVFGDGFETQVDPEDPNTVYSQYQYGGLVRFDRRSGEMVDIQPQPAPDEEPFRFNWDAALLISPHSHTRLYFGANKLFRSDDRGDTWRAVSPDLTRKLDRNTLEVMGRVWGVDAVAKNASTSFYGNIVALDESPLVEGLLYAGTDDGLIQVSEDGGTTWRATPTEKLPGAPRLAYVSSLAADRLDPDTVYATLDNHKMGDFAPYVYVSHDRGRTWSSLRSNLPGGHVAWCIRQDHVKGDLLFLGTEYGLWTSVDGGAHWVQLEGGLPTVAVRDIDVQRRENDLALATFGRGFYILDDYTPLRHLTPELLEQRAALFPVRDALLYVERARLGLRDKAFQGDAFFVAPNPPFGAVFTYFLKDTIKTRTELRREREAELRKAGKDVPYPSWDELRAEDREREPRVLLAVRDGEGRPIKTLEGSREKGIHRTAWDLRYPSTEPIRLEKKGDLAPWDSPPTGRLAAPGTYSVTLQLEHDGKLEQLAEPVEFRVLPLGVRHLDEARLAEAMRFYDRLASLRRAVLGADRAVDEIATRLDHLEAAALAAPGATGRELAETQAIRDRLESIRTALEGDRTVARRNEPTLPGIVARVERIVESQWHTTQPPTTTQRQAYEWAANRFGPVLEELRRLAEQDLRRLEERLEQAGAPWTPCRVPEWRPDTD